MIPECKQVKNRINKLEDNNVYSTEEKVVGTWIDGKPLYRKVIETTTPTVTTDGTSVWQQAVIKNVAFGRVVSCDAKLSDTSNYSIIRRMNTTDTSLFIQSYFTINPNNNNGILEIVSNYKNYNDKSVIAIVEYTKTTD